MIEKIDFEKIEESSVYGYAKKLDFFQKNKEVHFKPGLNIIFAPNGTGKSTLLEIMAKFTASEQGGISTITSSWKQDMIGHNENKMQGIQVFHDGQPTMYNNPRKAVGLFGGMAAFDDDFFNEGVMETQLRESTGYTTMARLQKVLNVIAGEGKMPHEFAKKVNIDEKYGQFLEAKIEKGQQTIILDEPESGLAIHAQSKIFRMIEKAAKEKNLQIIIATHSPFALMSEANFIELHPGYIQKAKYEIQILSEILNLQDKIKEKEENNKVSSLDSKNNEKPIKKTKKKPI